jgi:tRNA A37 threonylcarbamoyladenosine modification protein TsaB
VSAAADVLMPADHSVSWAAAGRGLIAWPELAERALAAGAELHANLLPRASEVLQLARAAVAACQILDPTDALPVYVRDRVTQTL